LFAGCVASPADRGATDGSDTLVTSFTAAAVPAGATTRTLTLQTAVAGDFVSAANGGGGNVTADRAAAQGWETFTLYDLNGGTLQSGDLVNLGTEAGFFFCAENGGGGVLDATRTDPASWETFRVTKIGGTGTAINDGDQISLQTEVMGLFVSAANGGGAGITADRPTASGWEAFVVGGSGATTTPPPPPPSGATEFAPYFYTWGWGSSDYSFSSLASMKSKGGPSAVTIAFVLAGSGCNASTDIQNNLADVRAYTAAGGHVKASFGGADGTYLEYNCSTASAFAGALTRFVDATGVTDLDFDLEQGGASSNATLNALRAAGLKQAQTARNIRVAFTLPVGPGGLEQDSIDIVRAAVNAGVQISFINGMTMDYGDNTNLGTVPEQSSDALANQIRQIFPSLTLAQAYRMVGITPMIGKNDDNETFTLANANTLISYAKQKQVGLVTFWAIQRDQVCPGGTLSLDRCNGQNTSLFQYSKIFAAATQP
jgi:chitinase